MKSVSILPSMFKILFFVIISINIQFCSAWPGFLLGLASPADSKKSPMIFLPPGDSAASTAASITANDAGLNASIAADFIVSQRTGLVTSESGSSTTITVTLNKEPKANVTLHLSSPDSTEINIAPPVLTFTPGNWSIPKNVMLTGVDDSSQDGNRSVTIDLGNAVSTDPEFSNKPAGTVEVQNMDNDTAGITVSVTTGHIVTEAGGTSTFTVVLNTAPTADVTIPIVSNDTTEGTVSPASLVFTSANWNTPRTVTITGVDDSNADGNINFSVALNSSVSTDSNYNGLSQPNIGVTNQDNDTAGLTIINPTLTTNESGTSSVFYVVLNSQPTASVTVPLTNNNTAEGSLNTSSLTFSTSSWNIQQAVTVTGINDFDLDGNITYSIQVGAPVSSDTVYNGLSPQSVSVTNVDNDSPGFDITAISGHTSEDLNTAFFKVKLLTIPSSSVTINFSSSDTTEGTIQSGASLTFTTVNWNTYQTVTVKGVNDSLGDGDIAYTVITSAASSADANYNGIDPADVSVVNDDNDTAGVIVTVGANPLLTTESAGKATFTVKLRTKPTANVTFTGISSSNTTAGTVSPANLTFTPVNWSIPQTVTITGVNNDYYNPAGIVYTINIPSPTSTDANYTGLAANTVNCKNTDNDTKNYTISKTKNFITGDSSKSDTFTIRLNTQPVGGDVVIPVTSSNSAEVAVSPASLTFTAANWNTPQTVTLTGQPDGGFADGAKIVTVALGTPTAASSYKNYYPNATGSDYDTVMIPDYNGATANNGMISINNCDTDSKIAVCLPPATDRITSETGTTFQYYVLLNQAPTDAVTFNVSVSDPLEGKVSVTSITKDSSNWDTIQLITVTGLNDAALEAIGQQLDGNKLYTVIHSAAVSTDTYYNGYDPDDIVNITNTDPDVPDIIMTPSNTTSSRITLVNNATTSVTVRLNAQPAANTTITLSGTGFTSVPSTLTFTSANWNIDQNVSVTYSGSAGNKQISTSVFASADTKFNSKAVSDIFFSIVQPGFTISAISGNTDETGTTRTFTVKLNSPPSANVVVNVASLNTNEVIVQSGAVLTFTSANWNTNQTVTVKGVDDGDLDGDQTVVIDLQAAVSTDTSYSGLDPANVTVINLDND